MNHAKLVGVDHETLHEFDRLWHYSCVGSPPSRLHSCSAFPSSWAFSCQRRLLQRVFRSFDQNNDGLVSTQEIAVIQKALGIRQSTESDRSLLARLTTRRDDQFDEDEFVLLAAEATVADADVDPDLLEAFHVFDKDGNGFISPSELQSVFRSLGFTQGQRLEACAEMIRRVDGNGDGQIDFSEFKQLFNLESAPHLISVS